MQPWEKYADNAASPVGAPWQKYGELPPADSGIAAQSSVPPSTGDIFDRVANDTSLAAQPDVAPAEQAPGVNPDVQAYQNAMQNGVDAPTYNDRVPDIQPGVSAAPRDTGAELSNLGQFAKGVALDTFGTAAHAGAGLVRGITLGAINPSEGTIGVPFTSKKAQVVPPLSENLLSLGVSPEIANNPYIQAGPSFVASFFPWGKAAKLVGKGADVIYGLKKGEQALATTSKVANVGAAARRIAETGVTGALVGAAEVRNKDESMLHNALVYGGVGAGLHLTAEVALPIAQYVKSAVQFKNITKNISAEDIFNAFTGREGASADAVAFIKGLSTEERVVIAKGAMKGQGVTTTEKAPRFSREKPVKPEGDIFDRATTPAKDKAPVEPASATTEPVVKVDNKVVDKTVSEPIGVTEKPKVDNKPVTPEVKVKQSDNAPVDDFTLTAQDAPKAKKKEAEQQTLIEVQPKFPEGKLKAKVPQKEGFQMADNIEARKQEARQTDILTKKEPWETSDLATTPNILLGRVKAEKQPAGEYKLLFTGTTNEVFTGERFKSVREARDFFKAQRIKAQKSLQVEITKKVQAELGAEVDKVIGDVSPIKPLKGEEGAVGLDISKKPKGKKPTYKFSDKAIEARFEAAKGVVKPPIFTRARDALTSLKNKATREYEHLPRSKEYAQLRFNLLRLSKQKGVTGDKTLRSLQGVTIKLDKAEFDLFRRKVILDDLTEVAVKGQALPFDFTVESLSKEKTLLDVEVAKHPIIGKSIESRTRLWDAVKGDYIEAMKTIGFNVEKRLQNKNYYRHQVLEYVNLKATYGGGNKLKTPKGRGFLKERKGSTLDINTDYIQAEYEVMAQILYDTEIARTIASVDNKYNIAKKVRDRAKKKGMEDWHDAIPEGYIAWQPTEGNVFYMADSISAKLAENLQIGALKEFGLTKDDIKTVLARGGKFREFVVREEIAETLDNLTKVPSRNLLSIVDKKLLRTWKVWTLVSPRRWFKYNLRNVTGDADATFVGNSRAFLKVPRAVKELYNTVIGDKAMTPDLVDWFERGGIESTLQAQELGDLNKLRMFMRLQETKSRTRQIPLKVWQGYWKAARTSTDMREALLRYAAYLDYLEQMQKNNGTPNNFGASVPEEVMGLSDIKDRAYWLSNDLLGAYDRVSVAGHSLREHAYPFWSWKEVNFKRYVQFWKNAWNDKRTAELVGRRALKGVAKSPYTAYRVGKLLLKATALWSMLQVWNHTVFPDEEYELPEDQKRRPLIILGRDKNGKIRNFTRLGALGDFLQWFGLDAPVQHLDNWFKGKRTLKEIAIEMAKSPANVIGQGITPLVKVPVELLTRRSLFPDMFKPGTVRDRGYHFARSLGLENEYKLVAGLPSEGYMKSLTKLFIYTSDPLQSAYHDIQNEKSRFKAKIGKSREGFILTPRGNALYNYKLAIRYGDKKASVKALSEYVLLGGTQEGSKRSLKMMDPFSGLSSREQDDFYASLSSADKEKLEKAGRFYREVLLGGADR